MDLLQYKKLKTKIRDKSFEINFRGLDKGLFTLSFLGNAGAIFFAFFLLNPALQETISQHLADSFIFQLLGIFLTVAILVGVEYVKRNVFKIFSAEFIQSSFNLFTTSVISLFTFSVLIFGASFYFSVNGGINFSKVSGSKNEIVVQTTKSAADSLTMLAIKAKEPIQLEIENLRASNKVLREKRDNTPINYRSVRNDYNALINANEKSIEEKQNNLALIEKNLSDKLDNLKNDEKTEIETNERADFESILLFLIISIGSELLIIAGIFFRELYEHKSFYEVESKLDPILKKREKYEYLLKLVYKNGEIQPDDVVISVNKLIQITKSKGAQYSSRIIQDFYNELGHLGAFKVSGNKRYAMVSYNEAKNIIESLQG